MGFYAGMDLHSRNVYVAVMESLSNKRVFQKRLPNDLCVILDALEPFRQELSGIALESTYNWYWLVDGLMDNGYANVHLANPSAIQKYEGLKHRDDRHDAFWLAHLLSLGILPQGYIYPKEERPVRDLLRKRSFLVKQRTSTLLNLQGMTQRQLARNLSVREFKGLEAAQIEDLFKEPHLVLSAQISCAVVAVFDHHIRRIEKAVKQRAKLKESFRYLQSIPGVGEILALTIMYEVGDIKRFPTVGNYSSYARCVNSHRLSNGKKKGKGNRKNGNRYLGWAYIEAANFARRYSVRINRYYKKKEREVHPIVARKAVSNKLARASYYIMRDKVPFREEALFN